jgi:hypothetical protein
MGLTGVTGTTSSSGQVTFTNVPVGTGYTAAAAIGTRTGSTSTSVASGGSTVTINLNTGSTGTLNVNVKKSGSNVNGATVYIQGGPLGFVGTTITGTTNSSGNVSFTLPVGSSYTLKAYRCSGGSPFSVTVTSVTINTGSNSQNVSFSSSTCPLS